MDPDGSVKMTHDGYLKLFQLLVRVDFATAMGISKPFDAILVDEAQVFSLTFYINLRKVFFLTPA